MGFRHHSKSKLSMLPYTRYHRLTEILQTPFQIDSLEMRYRFGADRTRKTANAGFYDYYFHTPEDDVYSITIDALDEPPSVLGIEKSWIGDRIVDKRTWLWWRVDFGVVRPGAKMVERMAAANQHLHDYDQDFGAGKYEFRVFSTVADVMYKFLHERLHTPEFAPVDVLQYSCWAGAGTSRIRLYQSFLKLVPQRLPEYKGVTLGHGVGNVPEEIQFGIIRKDLNTKLGLGPHPKRPRS